ncbi:MAG: uracil-DNA glycosylase [Phycisphaerales bacterium]
MAASAPVSTQDALLAGFDRAFGLEAVPRPRAAAAPLAAAGRTSEPVARTPEPVARTSEPVARTAEPPARDGALLRPDARIPASSLVAASDRAARIARLQEIEQRHAASCPHCTVATAHTNLVFGEGDPDAELFFVGEAPGETEDRLGRPFVGAAGQKLDEMIRAMGFERGQVYIANVLKSRPPENRTPLQHEIDGCGPFLLEQLLAVRPKVIVTLGGPATKLLLGIETGITRARGVWHEWAPPAGSDCEPIPVMPTYHPAYLLRTYTPKVRGEVWSDLKRVLERLGRPVPGRPVS